ncbi:MAG: hypothetical protein WC188_11290 [Candidatus Caldatribacteriota bacterium]
MGAYSSYYNDSIGISEDLYGAYVNKNDIVTIDNNVFKSNKRIVKNKLDIILSPKHFLFHINSRFEDATTQLFYVPNIQLPNKIIKDYKFRKRYYNIFSIFDGRGQLFQIFSIPEDYKNREQLYSSYYKECNAIIARLCYGNYYKISYWNDSKLTIDLSKSIFYQGNINLSDLFDRNDLLDNSTRKIVAIPSNRSKVLVSFKFSDFINEKYKKQDLFVTIYYRDDLIQKREEAVPLLSQRLETAHLTSSFDISESDYSLMVLDNKNNLLELVFFSIW